MPSTLNVFNPSDKERLGQCCIPWREFHEHTKIKENELVLKRGDMLLPYQIDTIDPTDPSSKMLVFCAGALPRSNKFPEPISISVIADKCKGVPNPLGNAPELNDPKLELNIVGDGIKFRNGPLGVWFNLNPKLDREGQTWYAGAATSVELYGRELLDTFPDPFFHDIEKRCMQLDFVELFRPSWEPKHYWDLPLFQKQTLFDRPYHVVSSSTGAVRASVTIASESFDYSYRDPFTQATRLMKCRVYRVINLWANAEYFVEDLYVKAIPQNGVGEAEYVHLYFVPHFFAYLNFPDLNISRFDIVPDWFSASNLLMPFQSYAYATDRHTTPIEYPEDGFPDDDTQHRSFSFSLFPCKVAKSLHIFMRYDPPVENLENLEEYQKARNRARSHFEDRAGSLWDAYIFKPVWVELA